MRFGLLLLLFNFFSYASGMSTGEQAISNLKYSVDDVKLIEKKANIETGSGFYKNWKLSKKAVVELLSTSRETDGLTFHQYDWFPFSQEGFISNKFVQFTFEIN